MDLIGKVAIVTGASIGIGRAYALALAGAGATVIAAARTAGRLEQVVDAGVALPGRIHAEVCDVEREADVAHVVGRAVSELGRIDVLVNNAAVMPGYDPLEISCDDWDRVMRVNVRGPYLTTRHVAPHMIRQASGSIVNITARAAGFLPASDRAHRTLVYAVSKAALNRLSHFMAEELRPHGIAVNALSPGVVATDTALARGQPAGAGKPATPEVLGPPLLHLAQQTADGLTGAILHADDYQRTWGRERP